jgi:hypothetical protein
VRSQPSDTRHEGLTGHAWRQRAFQEVDDVDHRPRLPKLLDQVTPSGTPQVRDVDPSVEQGGGRKSQDRGYGVRPDLDA